MKYKIIKYKNEQIQVNTESFCNWSYEYKQNEFVLELLKPESREF